MRTIPPALLATLQSDVQTLCTLWKITRTDNQVFGFTDLDVPLTYDGVTYESAGGYTHSQIDMTSDLSTSNLEVQAVFDSSSITPAELESGAWDFAQVVCSIADYTNLAAGAVILSSGTLGQITITNGAYQVELRGLAQLMQQEQGDIYSPTCRAQFGDSKCTIDLAPLTVTGTVGTVNSSTSWNDASLTQVGPTVAYVDTVGHKIPTQSPGQIQIVPPNGGTFVSDTSVIDGLGDIWNKVSSGPGSNQYAVNGSGLYTFDWTDNPGIFVFINYMYAVGFFSFGKVTWLTGQNAGFVMEVKAFSPGVVTLGMAMPYTISAGCDKGIGTCNTRFNNIIHFRGEPYIPGPDILLAVQT
jgi:hypothetical protein